MKIRDLTPYDFEQYYNIMLEIHNLHAKNRPDIFKAADKSTAKHAWDFEKLLADDNITLFGMEDNGNIIGICQISMRISSENNIIAAQKRAHIDQICISQNYRRKGMGTLLYNEAVQRAREQQADSIELSVWDFNKAAAAFYTSLGMTVQYSIMGRKL